MCLYVCVQVHQSRQHSQIPEIRTWVFWGDYYLSSHSHINGIKQYAVSHVWLLALSIMPLGIIQVVAYVNATLSGIPLYGWTTVCWSVHHLNGILVVSTFKQFWVVVSLSLSCVWLFVTPWAAGHQASLSLTISQSLLKFISIESVMLSNHLILFTLFSFCLQYFPTSRVFSKEVSSLHQVAKVSELQHQFFQWIFRVDFL